MSFSFLKMNGLGNDFVVVIAEGAHFEPTPARAQAIADRVTGIGCDQLIAITRSDRAHAAMRIWNADGGEVEACGNAARCVGWLLMESMATESADIETLVGILKASRAGPGMVTIDMGEPGLGWRDIPLAFETDTREVPLDIGEGLRAPGCVAMGNPHVVFFVPDAESVPVTRLGPVIERDPLFPNRTNVEFAQIVGPDRIRMKVWERGVGQTRACGTGACATLVAAHRRGLCERRAVVTLDGGDLTIEWRESDNHVLMTGPVTMEFSGHLPS